MMTTHTAIRTNGWPNCSPHTASSPRRRNFVRCPTPSSSVRNWRLASPIGRCRFFPAAPGEGRCRFLVSPTQRRAADSDAHQCAAGSTAGVPLPRAPSAGASGRRRCAHHRHRGLVPHRRHVSVGDRCATLAGRAWLVVALHLSAHRGLLRPEYVPFPRSHPVHGTSAW